MAKVPGTNMARVIVESVLKQLMPELRKEIDVVRVDIRQLDAKVDNLRQEMYDKFEQNRDLFNQLGERIARVEGRLDEIVRGMERQAERLDRQSDKMDQWIE